MAGFIIEQKPIEIDTPMRPLYAMRAGDFFIASNESGDYLMRITGFTLRADHRLLSGVVARTQCLKNAEVNFCFRGPAIKGSIQGFPLSPVGADDFGGQPLTVTYTGHIHNDIIPYGGLDGSFDDFRGFLEGRRGECDQILLGAMIQEKLAARETINGCVLDMLREVCTNPTASPDADITKMNYWSGHAIWGYGDFARTVMAANIDGLDYELAEMLSSLSASITTGHKDDATFHKALLMIQAIDFDGVTRLQRATCAGFSPAG